MTPKSVLLLVCLTAACLTASAQDTRGAAPLYTGGSIVNAANSNSSPLAPLTIVSLYGKDLSYSTRSLSAEDLQGGVVPTYLPGAGTRVLVNNTPASLYYVSPQQINFLMPNVGTGTVEIRVTRDALVGAAAKVSVSQYSPALFQVDPEFAIASRADGSLYDLERPAHSGDVVIFYATGLGLTRPRLAAGEIANRAAPLDSMRDFHVYVGPDTAEVLYAGAAPGFAGLYQINVKLPQIAEQYPEVRIALGSVLSPAGIRIRADKN